MSAEMTIAVIALVLGGAALGFSAALYAEQRRTTILREITVEARMSEPNPTPKPAPLAEPPAAPPAFLPDRRALLAPPPMVDGVVLRDWLINHTNRDGVWAEVVREFYRRAAAVPEVVDYFRVVLARPDGMDELQRHFTRALVLVTGQGVTQGLVDAMAERHAPVVSTDQRPITAGVWDQVIGALVDVLTDHGVPERGIAALATTIVPFRRAIVREG